MVTIPKTITIDAIHDYVLMRLGLRASQVLRDAVNDLIEKNEDAKNAANDWNRLHGPK